VSSRSLKQRLEDILEQSNEILDFADGLDFEAFCADTKTIKAVLYDLAVIGEAARSLLPDILDIYPELPWEEMRSLRNLAIHEYFRISVPVIWQTIREDLPILIEQIQGLIDENI